MRLDLEEVPGAKQIPTPVINPTWVGFEEQRNEKSLEGASDRNTKKRKPAKKEGLSTNEGTGGKIQA